MKTRMNNAGDNIVKSVNCYAYKPQSITELSRSKRLFKNNRTVKFWQLLRAEENYQNMVSCRIQRDSLNNKACHGFYNNVTGTLYLVPVTISESDFSAWYWKNDYGYHGNMEVKEWYKIYTKSTIINGV